jgi:FOG: FHA domain
MRGFRFTAKNIGDERYLTYIMGEGCELDEDTLDICEEGVNGLVGIIYEEDEDFDYLTYDITGKTALDNYTKGTVDKKTVFTLVRNVARGIIEFKEMGIPLSYILLNRNFMYVNPDTLDIEYICLPVESEGSVAAEFKAFMRQFIANLMYNVDEDLSYVGQLLTYINGDSFNLRGLMGLIEALMKDAGMDYEAEGDISTEDGDVIVSTDAAPEEDQGVSGYMDGLDDAEGNLPEIGYDDEEDVDVDVPEEEYEEEYSEESEDEEYEEPAEEEEEEEDDDDGPETVTIADIRAAQKSVKVNRAALIQNNAHAESETENLTEDKAPEKPEKAKKKDKKKEKEAAAAAEEQVKEEPKAAASAPVADTEAAGAMLGNTGAIKINPYLTRETTKEKAIITKNVFKIGKASRGVDYKIEGNNAISRVHAIITLKDNQYFIKDNKSTNHTYVNHEQINGDEEVLLSNNCVITLGDEDFIFKLR